MRRTARILCLFSMLLLLTQLSRAQYAYLPTAIENDAKMIIMAGGNLSSLSGLPVQISFEVAQGIAEMEVGVFDGDSFGYTLNGHWDNDYNVYPPYALNFLVYADPTGKGTDMVFLGEWLGDDMVDNAWYDIKIPQPQSARIESGNYRYRLIVQPIYPNNPGNYNNFKIRVNGKLNLVDSILGFMGMINGINDFYEVFPNYPSPTPSNYDGEWVLYLYLPEPVTFLEIWDGDFDHGNANGTIKDTDDPDTPNDVFPEWSPNTGMRNEGVAIGYGASTGSPSDDRTPSSSSYIGFYHRPPSVYYEIIDPLGNCYVNDNPSGNVEWERFRIDTAPFDRSQMDHHADELPAGLYTILLHGVDMHNANYWKFFNAILGQDLSGKPVIGVIYPPEILASVGDYVWLDRNKDGMQDADEPGIPGVTLRIYNDLGYCVSEAVTNRSGLYLFRTLPAGSYTIRIDETTIPSGFRPTTSGAEMKVTLEGGVDLRHVDFGYTPGGASGCGRPVFARYQTWYGSVESDSSLRHWAVSSMGGIMDTASFSLYTESAAATAKALFDSRDVSIWEHDILAAWAAEVDAFVVDWYGRTSYENEGLRGLLNTAESLYTRYGDMGFDFRIIVNYHEEASGNLAANLRYLSDSVLVHPAYYHGREGVRTGEWTDCPRPLFVFSPGNRLDAGLLQSAVRSQMAPDVEIIRNWDGSDMSLKGLADGVYPWAQASAGQWDDLFGSEWGMAYLERFYREAGRLDIARLSGGVWPGYDDRAWADGAGHWMDRQNGKVYAGSWELALSFNPAWILLESWNDFNRTTQVQNSVRERDHYYRKTRDYGVRWKGGRPYSREVPDIGMTIPERILAGRLLPLAGEVIEEALALFFRADYDGAVRMLDMGFAEYAEGQSHGNKLVFVKGTPCAPNEGWEHAVDGALTGWEGTVTSRPEIEGDQGPVGAIFRFADMGIYTFDYVTLLADNGAADDGYAERQAQVVEVLVSETGSREADFRSAGRIRVRQSGELEWYALGGEVTARYVKLLIHEPKWTSGGWRQIVEFGVQSGDRKGAKPASNAISLAAVPEEYGLHQNFPNPFNAATTISYQLPVEEHVTLTVYDVTGRIVVTLVNAQQTAGRHQVQWAAHNQASGIYHVRLQAGAFEQTRKLALMK